MRRIGLFVKPIPTINIFRAFSAVSAKEREELFGLGFVDFEILDQEDVTGQYPLTKRLSERRES